nr:RNA polymerase subunit sigma-70 [Eubacterium sp.]
MSRPEEELESLSDSELVTRYREGDRMAEEFLLKKYIPLVKKEIRYLYIAGAETDDLSQEAMIGLVKAIRDYDTEGGATFITYATTC